MESVNKEDLPAKGEWQLVKEVNSEKPNEIEALAHIPVDSLWFSGHFPGEPILPGVALVYLAKDAIAIAAGKRNEEIQLDALRRVRFTQPVRPGDDLALNIIKSETSGEVTLYSFKITNKENIVCNGLIAARNVKKMGRRIVMPESTDVKGIIRRVAEIIIEELKLEDITVETFNPDLDLIDELGIDSMDLATIALVLQDEYKVVIDEDDYPKLKTIRLIAEYIKEKLTLKG